MFGFNAKLSSVMQHPRSLFNSPSPLPSAVGAGSNFDWSNIATPTPTIEESMPTGPQKTALCAMEYPPEISSPLRQTSTTPVDTPHPPLSARSTPTLRSRHMPSSLRRAHPYKLFGSYSRVTTRPMPPPLFDWSSIASPTTSFSAPQTPIFSAHNRVSSPHRGSQDMRSAQEALSGSSVALPSLPACHSTGSRAMPSGVESSPSFTPIPQACSSAVPSNPSHATPLVTTWSRDGSPALALTRTPVPIVSPLPQPQKLNHCTLMDLNRATSVSARPTQALPEGSPHASRVCSSPANFGVRNELLSMPTTPTIGVPAILTTQPIVNAGVGTGVAVPHVTRAAATSTRATHTPLFLPPSPMPVEVPNFRALEQTNASPAPSGAICPTAVTGPVTRATSSDRHAASVATPNAPTAALETDAITILASPVSSPTPSITSATSPARRSPGNDLYATVSMSGQFKPTINEVDEELALAYGMELRDTGFQSWGQTSEGSSVGSSEKEAPAAAPGKSRTIKSPRQKKPTGTKWLGGPGGGMKFNSKPESYDESVGRRARWSYSEDGTSSQDVNERIEGDVHFSPAIQYTTDDDPFMSWVCTLTSTGLLRWVQFNAGQPHPQFEGYVFKPAQLPRTSPRWVKEASYKSIQRSLD